MTLVREVEQAIARIPGWQEATWVPLHGGLNNRTFKIDNGEKSAVLKIDDRTRDWPLNPRNVEARMQSRAHDAGLAAAVLYVDDRCYVTEYLQGKVWTSNNFAQTKHLQDLAAALRKLHSLPLTGQVFDAVSAARLYAKAAVNQDADILGRCLSQLRKGRPGTAMCFCHNDLVAANILSTPEIRFLDWEYAGDNDPLFDLATIVEHHELDEAQAETLLCAYDGGRIANRRTALEEQRSTYLALLWLWTCARSDQNPAALARITTRVLTRNF